MTKALDELGTSKSLRLYGIALTLTHGLTLFSWRNVLPAYLADAQGGICWPAFEGCRALRFTSMSGGIALLSLYGLAILVVLALFVRSLRSSNPVPAAKQATIALALLTAFKFALFSLDYRFMGNYHYMGFLLTAAFVLVPERRTFLPVLLCLFYVSAGLLKFNQEWLSGAALLAPPWLTGPLLKLALFAVIPFELFLIWGLTLNPLTDHQSRTWFMRALVAVAAFHAFSWHIVGYFYPCTMALLLSIMVLPWATGELASRPSIFRRFFTGKSRSAHYACAALFMLAQLPEHVARGDSTLTGEGRLFGLNMLDAQSVCTAFGFARFEHRTEEHSFDNDGLGVRIHCDPIVFYNQARILCEQGKADPSFRDLDLYVQSRRKTDSSFRTVIHAKDFCANVQDYAVFSGNPWILTTPPAIRGISNGNPVAWPEPVGDHAPLGAIHTMFRIDAARSGHVHDEPARYRSMKSLFRAKNGNVGIHTASKSSPALDDSGVYVGGDSGWFHAYDWQGALRWSFFAAGASRGIHGSAALDENSVYLGAYNGRMYRLNKATGAVIWAIDLGDAHGASPALVDDALYANVELSPPNGYLLKLDRVRGALQWISASYGEQSHASPAVDVENGVIFAGSNDYFFRAFDLHTGALRWSMHTGGTIKSTASMLGDAVFATSRDKGLYAMDRRDGHQLWRYPLLAPSRASPTPWPAAHAVLVGDESGTLHLVDAETGAARWTRKFDERFQVAASATLVGSGKDSLAIVACAAQRVCMLDLDGNEVASLPTRGSVTGTVSLYQGRLCFSEDAPGDLVCYTAQ